jgi:hypothetical protein
MRGVFRMKWFRSNIRTGARLALLALLVQFALSFGHVHGLAAPAVAATQNVMSTDHADKTTPQPAPGKHDSDQTSDGCAICAVMAMAGTVLFASPPILLLPEAVEILHRITDAEFAHLKSAGTAFQPRAPPAS